MEVILDALKLLLSPSTTQSGAQLIELIRQRPEWQKDICTIEVRLAREYSEQARFIRGLTAEKMVTLGYSEEAVSAFITVASELIENVFEHGFTSRSFGWLIKSKKMHMTIEVTKFYIAISIENPQGNMFNALKERDRRVLSLKADPQQIRGRGLVLISELADSFERTANKLGIKAVIYSDRVSIAICDVNEVVMLSLMSGLWNPSCSRRIEEIASQYSHCHLILDFSKWGSDRTTAVASSAVRLINLRASSGKQLVAIIHYTAHISLQGIPKKDQVDSLKSALQVLNLEHLEPLFLCR